MYRLLKMKVYAYCRHLCFQGCEGISEWAAVHRLCGQPVLLEVSTVEIPGEVRPRKWARGPLVKGDTN